MNDDVELKKQRLSTLRIEHENVHKTIEFLERAYAPDEDVTNQKKFKLKLKEQIDAIEKELTEKGVSYE